MSIKPIKNFLIINCVGKDDKLGLRINKDFFIRKLENFKNNNDKLVYEISKFLNEHKIQLDENFSVLINQGPGSFSRIRTTMAVAMGLEISKNVNLYGFNDVDLQAFDKENIEQLLEKKLIEKKLIKPIYLS
tara:strand:+ start:776 stop:1171 length:396 start_codon:yes stop_codon:yes gene_type:complete